MISNWHVVSLGDVVQFKNGKKRPTTTGEYPIYGGNGILDYAGNYNYENVVVIGRVGAYCGSVFLEPNKLWVSDNAIAAINLELSEIKYDYYLLKYLQLNQRQIGTGQPLLTQEILNSITIFLPPLSVQRSIATTLSCLDDKIELNNRINANLEAQAQAIFKSWFVDFAPFRDGEFVDSELGKIPKGWQIKPLYDYAQYVNGTSFKDNEYSKEKKGYPIIKIVELKNGITDSTQYCDCDKEEKYYVANGDMLFSWSGNPETSIDTFIWHDGVGILNQHTFKVIPNIEIEYGFVYFLLRYKKSLFTRMASNKQTTGLGHVTVADLKREMFVYSEEVVAKYCGIINPIFDAIFNNLIESRVLANVRDTLLPKLMSGEIEIGTDNT